MTTRTKQIFNKVTWEKVNKENKMLLDDYVLEMRSLHKSNGTIKQYVSDIKAFYCWVHDNLNNKSVLDLKRKDFRNFFLYLSDDRCLSSARINRFQCSIRNMLSYIEENEEDYDYERNVMSKIKGVPKSKARDIVFLTNEEIFYIYDRLIEEQEYSQALLCALMYDSAGRRNEMYQVMRDDISMDSNICKKQVVAKRGKTYRPIYNDMTKEAYKLLEDNRRDDNNYLWIDDYSNPVSYETLYKWVVSWREILTEKYDYKEFNAHSWRHSASTNLHNGTHYLCEKLGGKMELTTIQKLMNHSSIEITQSYIEDTTEDELISLFS